MADLRFPNEQEPSYQGVMDAIKRQLRLTDFGRQERIKQNVRTANLRTSGVGQLPQLEAGLGRQLGEATADVGLGQMRLGQLGSLEQMAKQAELQKMLMQYGGDLEDAKNRAMSSSQLRNALIAGVSGGATQFALNKWG